MTKSKKTIINILTESVGLYFSNFDKFIKYMSFPILGQIAGLALVFLTAYFYTLNLPKLLEKYPNLNSVSSLIILSIVIVLPGMAIFCKAFWEYLVAYGAVNSMFQNMQKSGKVYDFEAHTELIKRRTAPFIGLWFLLGIFTIFAICPLFWVICAIFAVYFILVFQVFTFEPDLSPLGCFKRSLTLVKGHFCSTFVLALLIGFLTYTVIPQIIIKGFDAIGLNIAFSKFIVPFIPQISDFNLAQYGITMPAITPELIALLTIQTILAQIIIQYTLPLRSILWSMWYKELNNGLTELNITSTKKKSKKRPSEKLMEESAKKYSQKNNTRKTKLDNNIIRRAMEKDDEDE